MFGYLCGQYPGLVGNLWSPGRGVTVWPFTPYALDNGAWVSFANQLEWSESRWRNLIDEVERKPFRPLWALVPDVVTDRERTIENWHRYAPVVQRAGISAAFAVQDGMSLEDIPYNADVIFVGGSTAWKWRTLESWCAAFPRVHVGRVNSYQKLIRCWEAGAESTDGTGWFRGRHRQLDGLIEFLDVVSGRKHYDRQGQLFSHQTPKRIADSVAGNSGKIAYLRPPSVRRVVPTFESAMPLLLQAGLTEVD